jgi:hypothetical protein
MPSLLLGNLAGRPNGGSRVRLPKLHHHHLELISTNFWRLFHKLIWSPCLSFDSIFVLQPPPGAWDHTVDEREHTVEQWKSLIYEEVRSLQCDQG